MYQKIETIKRPVKKGEKYLVSCIVTRSLSPHNDYRIVDGEPVVVFNEHVFITPVINHPHNDRENGQPTPHYHVDYRFVRHQADARFPTPVSHHSTHRYVENIRPLAPAVLEYILLPVINETFAGITPAGLISKSKLKHNCIYKGKCPHRGYDLSQVAPIDGVITCPLHGLQFDSATGQLLKPPKSYE